MGSWVLTNAHSGALAARLRGWFTDREFFVRSSGQVRFVKISARLQMIAAVVVAFAVVAWLTIGATVLVAHFSAQAQSQAEQLRLARQTVSKLEARQQATDRLAGDLVKRQEFIEEAVETHLEGISVPEQTPQTPRGAARAGRTTAANLSTIETRQLALVARLTQFADSRAAEAEAAIRKAGLNPGAMLARGADRSAQGGPLIPLRTGGELADKRFAGLTKSLMRMSALERGLQTIPNVLPASLKYISSGFGLRSDPFTGEPAMHAGLDFRGPVGAPIYAAARGRVSFAGPRAGYGNCVEISHGNGLLTRYAHMSAIGARVGQQVEAGGIIGAIGSTGRSTGPHLHFEVRLHDRPVNPRPLLEANANVHQRPRGTRPDRLAG